MTYAQEAQNVAERSHYRKGVADALDNIGNVYRRRGKYTEALENHFKSLRIKEEIGDKSGIASSLNNIGYTYNKTGQFKQAQSYLLDMNHLESGGFQLTIVSFDIAPFVEAAIYEYRTPAEAKNIMLHFSNEANGESIVFADEQVTMQVLDNLISNAVKYSPHGKNAFVRVLSDKDVVRIEVKDEGQGISPDDMKKLFGKFARLSAQPTGGEHSTGLGLSIVKKMVAAMQGKVWCESEVGRGATFIVELPRVFP